MKKNRVSLFLLLLALIPILTSSSAITDRHYDGVGEWQILTNHNFSSQIRLQPHILLLVTVPWSGEFRTLMKGLSQLITDDFSSLKLMSMYRNTERVLADAIGANDGEGMVTVLYYHHSVSYKYSGKLRPINILSSIKPYLSNETPIKTLNTEEEVKVFIESTDKAVLLVEFCGWTSTLLLSNLNNNGSGDMGFLARGFRKERDQMPISKRMDQKVAAVENEHGKMQCGIQSGFGGIPWSADFSVLNNSDSNSNQGSENITFGAGLSCSTEEFRKFEWFFNSKFMMIAKEFVLPSQRHRVGLVSDKSLLPYLGDQDLGLWSIMVYFNGCPSCTKIIKDSDNLKGALQADGSIVMELEIDGQDLEPEIPVDKASVILFIDRASNSSETRRKSKEALDVYRELALQHHIADQKGSQYYNSPEKSTGRNYEVSKSTSRSKRSPTVQKINQKDKLSFTIIQNGKPVSLDNIASEISGSNLREILEGLLQKKEKTKLSALAKDVGFRLLSDDVDVEIANKLPSLSELESNQVKNEETSTVYDGFTNPPISVQSDQQIVDDKIVLAEDGTMEGQSLPLDGTMEGQSLPLDKSGDQKLNFKVFEGPYFFSDGNHRLLRALTGGLKIPSLVIIDCTTQQHYVISENATFSNSIMADFLQDFLNGSLLPYQRSEFIPQGHRDATNPPFVNLDFHEVNSIPRVTTNTFTELVIGNKSDVLVLFSNTWCGFCQRMELVVREVYRAIKGYTKLIKNETEKYMSDVMQAPSIYLFDCTLNDCNVILKSENQREVYPTLMLFPAENKNAVPYNGDISVKNVVKFIADYGSNSQHLIHEKGILRTPAEKEGRNQDLVKDSSEKEAPLTEILLKDRTSKIDAKYIDVKSHTPKTESASNVVVGSILKATNKLLNSSPFDNSKILIVKANQDTGFEGLILNKHINWDTFEKMEDGLDFLKEAPLSFGGPIITFGGPIIKKDMPLVALTQITGKIKYPEAFPGVYFIDQLATVHEVELLKSGNHSSVTDYWFFLGYSTWGWNQLFHEISEGAWNLNDSDAEDFVWPSKVSESDLLID